MNEETTCKKIVMLTPNLNFGGAQRVFYDLSIYLSKKYTVCESVFNFDTGHAFPTGNKIVSLEVAGSKNALDAVFKFLLRCRRYRKLRNSENAFASISHMEGANFVNILLGGKGKTIIVEHGSKVAYDSNRTGVAGWLRKALIPFLFRRADKIIVVSRGLKKELVEQFRLPESKITIINNSFNLRAVEKLAMEDLPAKYKVIYQKRVIITSGRLAAQKNHHPLLDVFARLENRTLYSLVFIGDGNLLEELIIHANNIGLSTCISSDITQDTWTDADVCFLSYQKNPFKFIAKAEVFVLPSVWEGFPLALCEAMVCGVPVLSADCRTGPREILSPESEDQYEALQVSEYAPYGILMPMLNSASAVDCWATELNKVLADNQLREHYKKMGRERMKEFSDENLMNKWIQIIESK